MDIKDYSFMGVHFGWWPFIIVLALVAFVLLFRSHKLRERS